MRNAFSATGGGKMIEEKPQKDPGVTLPPPGPIPPAQTPLAPERLRDNHLVSFGDKVTYTFAHGKEVGSLHFDRRRGEIFYKGHNIRNMDLEEWQIQMMENFRHILETHERVKDFASLYGRVLDKFIRETRKTSGISP